MTGIEIIEKMIYPAIRDLNKILPEGKAILLEPKAPLFGGSGRLDSLGLVRLVLGIEQRVQAETKKAIRLVSGETMSRTRSPFQTIEALAEFVKDLIGEEKAS